MNPVNPFIEAISKISFESEGNSHCYIKINKGSKEIIFSEGKKGKLSFSQIIHRIHDIGIKSRGIQHFDARLINNLQEMNVRHQKKIKNKKIGFLIKTIERISNFQKGWKTNTELASEMIGDYYKIFNADNPSKEDFVKVLNEKSYSLDGKTFTFPPASKPVSYRRPDDLASKIKEIKAKIPNSPNPMQKEVVDLSTEEAIERRNGYSKIALNFANEHHAGGGPSCHRDPQTGKMVFDARSARAQEESLVKHTDLMDSLTQLPVVYEQRCKGDMARSYYVEPFNSEEEVLVSDNHLFALRAKKQDGTYRGFEDLRFIEDPVAVSFITSAAQYLGSKQTTVQGDEHYNTHKKRIETHLFASAKKALKLRQADPEKPVELILGAFGCGAFAPSTQSSL